MVDPHSTPARSRPSVVTISSYLLILFAVLQVINLIITLATIGTIRDVLRDAYAGTEANAANTIADVTFAIGIGSAIFVLLLAVVLVVLAVLNNRGKNGSRITTWILGGILVCCTGGSLISGAAGGFGGGTGTTTGDGPSPDEIQRRLDEALPGWFTPVSTLLGVIGVIALIVALILLALPKSNEYFRKPQAGWEPPVPGAAYPGYPSTPGYPQVPGQPGQSQAEPGYPPAAGYPPPGQPGYPPAPGQPGDQAPGSDRPGPTPPPVS
ncbi:hypothetical protein AB0J20_19745 [Micromonospora costi]|uniref:hypothetical protein n=1 Tax=Micromonospora costi TaxID=1530042 RepID=UPI003411BB3F